MVSSIVNLLLGPIKDLTIVKRLSEVAFVCGQPSGFYGSWSLFTMSHHYIVWLVTWKVCPNRSSPFTDYALLGDDNHRRGGRSCIFLHTVPAECLHLHSEIIISRNGTVEFAKRYWTKSMQVDLSPVSLKALWGSRTLIGHHSSCMTLQCLKIVSDVQTSWCRI